MSYILDALKKSDRDRPREGAALPLHEVPAFRARPRRSRRAQVLVGILLLALIAAAAGTWITRSSEDARREITETVSPPVPIAIARGAAPAVTTPAATPATSPVDAASPQPSGGESPAAPAAATREGLLELWQLTEAEQKYLQGLDVSFHVHSNDPSKRAVIINGLRAKEGQALGEDLRLTEIVPDGIVLEFQGQFVHLANPQPY